SLDEPDLDGGGVKPGQIGLKIVRTHGAEFKYMDTDRAVLHGQHTGQRQAIPAIVAFTAVYGKATVKIPLLFQPDKTAFGGPFHQVDGSYRLIFDGELIPGAYLFGRQDFHAGI